MDYLNVLLFFCIFFLQMVKLGYSDMRKAMAELMGFSPKEEDEPFIELFSECRFLSSILINNFVPQLLAVKA